MMRTTMDATPTARLKSGADLTFANGGTLGAPRFSPYRPVALHT
jgi:hypothetical protein